MNEKYYDVKELSQIFGLSVATIRSYFKTGKITALKIGKSWYAMESSIKDYLNQVKK